MILNQNGIDLGDGHSLPWSEILALHVTEIDTFTSSETILQLEHESGHYIEINELDDSYEAALRDLSSYLPLEENWISKIKGLEPRTSLTIWNR